MARHRTSPEAYRLLHEGAVALAEISHHGVRVDKAYLDRALAETAHQIRRYEDLLRADPLYRVWRRKYGDRAKLTAPDQLAGVIFDELGHTPKGRTASGKRAKADEASFEGIGGEVGEFVQTYFKAQKLRKGRGTYLVGIHREMVFHDGCWYVHPSYNLNTVATFRSSCNAPNWQNVPTRNKVLKEMVRRCYIPRPGFQLVEIDESQVEVRVSACYNHDPVLIDYIVANKDMHRDMAAQIFLLDPADVSSEARHAAKNKFVFPQFYGDFYPRCARSMWDAVTFQKIRKGKNNDGVDLREHLASKGIRELGACDPEQRPVPGTFEHHVKQVEEDFWGRRFRVYTQWKRDWYEAYRRDGGFTMHTGFAVNGAYSRNDVINYPVQGAAFHIVLWALPRINSRLRRCKMRSRVVGQIHDCVVGDVHPRERDAFIEICCTTMTRDVEKAWPWVIVPLETEAEVCPIDGCWFDKHVLTAAGDTWRPKDLKKWEEAHGPWELQVVA